MAKIIEDILVLKFSKITKDKDSDPAPALTNEHIEALIQVAQELIGEGVVIEAERA